ncbi:MFS transporter [Rhizobium oryziradicis]|uniref:Methyl viologen resistance protein SmvA n=1 Tax=Rhizobium oryziradicis TaxID=1867956 RepID=A0A1Q8ZX89_9HYPH|nr:MFS transporter [Rhizobium oryziradicis]OLP46522.1 methyl viologen resistance protein SmvA [Rhizobium oryziradicis]
MPALNRWLILTAVILAFVPIIVDMTILHIAVPSLTEALGASSTEVLWIIDIYPLIMAGLLVPMGTLGDRMGYRRLMLIGLVVFTIASVLAAFSISAPMLIAARVLLAIGAAMVMPCVLALIRQTFEDPQERAFALGLWTVVGSAGAAIGPLAGGFLLEHFWWGSVFLINVPIMAVVLPMAYFVLPRIVPQSKAPWKISQAILLIAGLLATVYAIKSAVKVDSSTMMMVLLFIVGVGLLTWFGRLQVISSQPMLDLSLFTNPAVAVGLLMAFVASGAFSGFELILAQELQYVAGFSPLSAGLFMMPLVIASALSGPIAGKLSGRFGLRPLAVTGLLGASISLFGIAMLDLRQDVILIEVLLAVFGFSMGVSLLASSVAIMGAVDASKGGSAGALESTGYELGAGLGITFFGVLLTSHYQSSFGLSLSGAEAVASHSIGEAMHIARQIGGERGEAIAETARAAFSSAHGVVLTTTSALLFVLTFVVFFSLRNHKDQPSSGH